MQLEIGKIYDGKVKGITQYGAFVDIEGGGTGMVHISEIANTFVNEIRDHLTENQDVKVKVIGINEAGKVSLSIKKAEEELIYLEDKLGLLKKFRAIQKSADELLKVLDSSDVDDGVRAKVREFADSVRKNF